MAPQRNIIGLNRTLTHLSSDENIFSEDSISWEYARNAITSSERTDRYILSNEPSNYLCCEVKIDGQPATIVGLIYLYDDKWCVFSTLNDEPDQNNMSEIGIFDKSTCCYIPVVRCKCLNFSKVYPVRGAARLSRRQNFLVYFGDSYNPDRVIDLGNYNLWTDCSIKRGDTEVMNEPWLGDIKNIPYITYDSTAGDNCYVAAPVLPLDLDCNRLSLSPKIRIPCINVKKSRLGGTLPNGLYSVAIAYSDGTNVYGNWFTSGIAHVYDDSNNNAIEIGIDFNDGSNYEHPFNYIKVAVVSHVAGQVTANIVGVYSVNSNNITISFIDKGVAEPISVDEILTRKPIFEKSDLIQKTGKHLSRLGPYSKFDFNYQPLANLIEVRWFSAEYDEKYYYDLKNNSVSARIEADVIQYLRDEVYTFYIRWIYDDGNFSSFYHIPGPPFEMQLCDDEDAEQKNNAVYLNNLAGNAPDGGDLLSEGYVGVFYSSERYDDRDYKRWNYTQFANTHLSNSQQVNITLPYGISDPKKFDLCGENIRLVRMPDENTHPTLKLYNSANKKVRYLGVKFTNIYHPVDEKGNLIQGLVGFEIWRAVRGANKTIIAKGVLNEARPYNYREEANSNNINQTNAIFESYPCDDDTNNENPFLGLSKIVPNPAFNLSNPPATPPPPQPTFGVSLNLSNRDIWDTNAITRYKNYKHPNFVYFHSPETTFGYPYLNASYIKVYADIYNDNAITTYFINKTDLPKAKLLSISEFSTLIQKSLLRAYRVLNGTIKIRYGGNDTSASLPYQAGADVATAGGTSIATIVVRSLAAIAGYQTAAAFAPSIPVILSGFNAAGLSLSDMIEMVQNGLDGIYAVGSVLGATNYKSPEIERESDGLIDYIPKDLKQRYMIPLYFFALNEVYYNDKTIQEASKPFVDFTLTGSTHLDLLDTSTYNDKCYIRKLEDSVYLMPYVYRIFDPLNNKDIHVNHKFRTQCVLSVLQNPLASKIKHDNTLSIRLFGNCCGGNTENSKPDTISRCNISNKASLRYVSYKVNNTSPYSQLYGQIKFKMGCYTALYNHKVKEFTAPDGKKVISYFSDYYYGGDTYVCRYTEIDKFMYFSEYPYKLPDGFEFNYLGHRNILYPRFWANTQKQSLYESYLELFKSVTSSGQTYSQLLYCGTHEADCQHRIDNYSNLMSSLGIDISECKNSLKSLCTIVETLNTVLNAINQFSSAIQNLLTSFAGNMFNGISNICGNLNCNGILECLKAIVLGIVCLVAFIGALSLFLQIMIGIVAVGLIASIIQLITSIIAFITAMGVIIGAITCLASKAVMKDSPLILKNVINYNLDGCTGISCAGFTGLKRYLVADSFDDLWMYLAHGIVRDFFVETSYNLTYRTTYYEPYGMNTYDPYEYTDTQEIFSVKNLRNSDFFIYDDSMKLMSFETIFASKEEIQPRDYDETDASKAFVHDKRLLIYSLAQTNITEVTDRWRIYLPLNLKYFDDIVTGIQDINGNGAMVFFRFSPPQFYPGTENLQLKTGRELIIGTGGLFAQAENTSSNADKEYQYGSLQSVTGIANTPFGLYFISNNTRKIFSYTGNLIPISDKGLKLWANWYVGFYIKEQVKGFDDVDNTLLGIGDLVTCDNRFGLVYFVKRDLNIKKEYSDYSFNYAPTQVIHNPITNTDIEYRYSVLVFDENSNFVEAIKIYDFKNSKYVEDISWTLSYDPYIQSFVSYHDWHPNFAEGSNDVFITVIENSIWVHNKNCHSFCNYYGKGYNFEVDIREVNKNLQVLANRSIEYYLEAYKFGDNCMSNFHKLDENFDNLVVYNTEQCSGLLNLIMKTKNNPFDSLNYPKVNFNSIDVLYEKVEQKYRINMYYDIIKDRGEYTGVENPIFIYSLNGIDRTLNLAALDYNKPFTQHKRFRHYVLNKYFIKKPDNKLNYIPYKLDLLLFLNKNNLSAR